jgi:hypothetical protein
MKRYMFFLGFIISMSLFHVSCNREESKNVNQDRIYTIYELYYNANEDITYARATFRFSNEFGTKLKLSDPSAVYFNNQILTFKEGLAYYERAFAGFLNSGDFLWKDIHGKIYNNSISVNTIDFPASLASINRANTSELTWVGDPLQANELVTLWVNGPYEGDAQTFTQDNMGSSSVLLARNKLQLIAAGNGFLMMDRIYKPALTDRTEVGGKIKGRYRAVNRTVVIQ